MRKCCKVLGGPRSAPWSCCYGAPGCTAKRSVEENSMSRAITSTGTDPKQESTSEQQCQSPRLDLSSDANLQDLYLLLRGLSEGGFDVSVTVLATPNKPSAPSPSDTLEQCISWIEECPSIAWPAFWDAVTRRLKSTTPSSKPSDWYEDEYGDRHGPIHIDAEKPKNRRY